MANLMANDSGAASTVQHMALIAGMLVGQALTGAAGIPAGLAFFCSGNRKVLFLLFLGLFIPGAVIQAGVLFFFFAAH